MHRRRFLALATRRHGCGRARRLPTRALHAGIVFATVPARPLDAAAFRAAAAIREDALRQHRLRRSRPRRRPRCSCTASRSTASSGAAPSSGLSPHRRCIAPDFLGLGYTEVAPGQSVAPDAQVGDAGGAARHGSASTTVDLVANDSGGAVAQMFVARYPQARAHAAADQLRCRDRLPAAGAAAGHRAGAGKAEFVAEWLAPWLADKTLARSPQGIGGMCFTHPRTIPPTRRSSTTSRRWCAPPERTHAYAIALERNSLAGIEPSTAAVRRRRRGSCGAPATRSSPRRAPLTSTAASAIRAACVASRDAKLFLPEEFPGIIAEEARRLWGV